MKTLNYNQENLRPVYGVDLGSIDNRRAHLEFRVWNCLQPAHIVCSLVKIIKILSFELIGSGFNCCGYLNSTRSYAVAKC